MDRAAAEFVGTMITKRSGCYDTMSLSLRLRTRGTAVRTAVSHRIAPSLGLSIRNPCRFRHHNDGNDTDLFDLGTLMLIFRAARRRDQLKLSGIVL